MIGYIYKTDSREIVIRLNNVIECGTGYIVNNDTEGEEPKGIEKITLGEGAYLVTDQEFNVGDILPLDIVDYSDNFESEKLKQDDLINQLLIDNLNMQMQIDTLITSSL